MRGLVRSVQTPEFAGMTFHEVLAKSALNHTPSAANAPWSEWSINPYRGCSHACTFCFARQTHTYLDFDAGRDFDAEIVVKVNIADILAKELARPSWQRQPVALGTNTDPYQRAEGRYRLMPGIIAALAASGTPFSILTKGTLLRRDIPLLQAAAEHVPVEIAMTVDVFDSGLRETIEPGAPTTEARLATVRALRDAGLPCAVFVMPVLPHLTDSVDHLDRAFAAIAAAGATSVAYSALHLKPGAREWFLAWLQRERPELVARYAALYPPGVVYAPTGYRRWLAARVRPLLSRHGLVRSEGSEVAATTPRVGPGADSRMLANELPASAAAGLQPTLF
jgi:DNA repair photolyase